MAEITVLPHSAICNTPRASVKGTLLKLSEFFGDWLPEKPRHYFVQGFFVDMWFDPATSGDAQIAVTAQPRYGKCKRLKKRLFSGSRPFDRNELIHEETMT